MKSTYKSVEQKKSVYDNVCGQYNNFLDDYELQYRNFWMKKKYIRSILNKHFVIYFLMKTIMMNDLIKRIIDN